MAAVPHGVSDIVATRSMEGRQIMAADGSAAGRQVSVQVCGRLVSVPPDASLSLSLMNRHLAQQLKISGQGCLQLSDVGGRKLLSDQDLAMAIQNGRYPFQAAMTAAALREIEQKKSEVENKKEELAQFQWQVVVDQISQMAKQVAALTSQLQGVKDECSQRCQSVQQEEAMSRERMEEAITREVQQREVGLKDIETKIDKLVQAICGERSARDVAIHQLGAQINQAVAGLEADRAQRVQERAETDRALSSMKHQVEAEAARNEEQWNWHLETAKRLDSRLEEGGSADTALQLKISEIEASVECLKATTSSLEATQASHGRSVQEMMTRRGEELSKAVRDEMLGRETHIARFAKELETSWQSLEARLQRGRDEASRASAGLVERTRVLENRCAEVEKDLSNYVRSQNERDQVFTEKLHNCMQSVDNMEMALKSSDVVTHTTVSQIDDIVQRLVNVEDDLQQKVSADYWQPQMDALQRNDLKFETKLLSLEKDMMARFSHESAQRDGVKSQLQDSMKSCMEKIASVRTKQHDRFIEVEPVSKPDDNGGLVTPRCAYGSPVSPQVQTTIPMPSVNTTSASVPPGSAVLPARALGGSATPLLPGSTSFAADRSQQQVVRQISLAGGCSSPRVVVQSPMYRSASPQAVHPAHIVRTTAVLSPRMA